MRTCLMVAGVALAGFLCGCASEGIRVDASAEVVSTQDFNVKDLQLISEKMIQSLGSHPAVNRAGGKRPIVYVHQIQNRTDEHIDTNAITELVSAGLLNTGKVRYTDQKASFKEAVRQLQFQQGSFTDPATAKQVGKMINADYFLMGQITNIRAKAGGKKSNYFLFTLSLVNIETLEVEWKGVKQIQKIAKKGVFGW